MDLPDHKYEEICEISSEADSWADQENYDLAVAMYEKGVALLPEPKLQWEAWTWLYSGIGDAYFLSGDWQRAFSAFMQAMKGPRGRDNPFVHLRLGQAAKELGNKQTAKDHLLSAYLLEGKDIFDGDEEYFEFLSQNVQL